METLTSTKGESLPNLVKFGCPGCGQHIEARREILGEVVTCPTCSIDVRWLESVLEGGASQSKTISEVIPGRVVAAIALGLFGVVVILLLPLVFAVMTALYSLRVLGNLESEKNIHELSFYTLGPPSKVAQSFLVGWGRAEAIGRSLLLGVLAYFLFGGDDVGRRLVVVSMFGVLLPAAICTLRRIEKKMAVDVVRMGFLKFGVLFGLVFSFLINIFSAFDPWVALRSAWNSFSDEATVGAAIDLAHQAANLLNWAIEGAFRNVVGELLAKVIAAALNTDLVYGLILFVYAAELLRYIAPKKAARGTPV